jgi:hypothetical protein
VQVRGWERIDASVYLQGKVKFERLKSVVSESFVVSYYEFLDEAVTVDYCTHLQSGSFVWKGRGRGVGSPGIMMSWLVWIRLVGCD